MPRAILPRIAGSAEKVAVTRGFPHLPDGVPIAGIAGDQQAALFGQACFGVGDAKCTYGTGAFVLVNIGDAPIASRFGLLTTVAWKAGGKVGVRARGQRVHRGRRRPVAARRARHHQERLRDSSGWRAPCPRAGASPSCLPSRVWGRPTGIRTRAGLICGLTRGSTAAHLARATLEGVALEVGDLLGAMADDLGKPLGKMRVDGGAAANDLLVQFQADVAEVAIERPTELESTARGAAMLAGVGAGLFPTVADAAGMSRVDRTFEIEMSADERAAHRARWADAIGRTRAHGAR